MIKRQYSRYIAREKGNCYFNNFLRDCDRSPEDILQDELNKYKATIAKSKQPNIKMNIQWHDEQLYTLFVLRYS